ncbi:unnamed protein product [Peronospora belbahrii]|uniref:Uncharacterized protein n=1 Tax=Peronospora belbahrii TaxID=622444 RepID=A0AAU9L335_9STRA|nr:unnamed protein product [Peronospora belbahrii]CAH0517003.1 unnamed protein product [Peronospora belbahrii]
MNEEEEEFGMNKMSRDADPMEHETKSMIKNHSDFKLLNADEIRAAMASEDKRAVPMWMTDLPVEKDPSKWTILEVQIRPDRSWEVIKDLVATICIGKGLLIAEEHVNWVLFRKKVTQESMAHGMANTATYLNVYVHIGVSPSKLRVVDICTLILSESNLLGGIIPAGRSSLWTAQDYNQPHKYALDQLLGALQLMLLSQCLSLSHLYMSSPDNSMDLVENAELDEGYVTDLKSAFSSEMKANIRDLCIPLESYAYDQEYACALLIGLLEPTLKKHAIQLTDRPTGDGNAENDTIMLTASVESVSIDKDDSASKEVQNSSGHERETVDTPTSVTQASCVKSDKTYGEVVSEMVQNLWRVCKEDCEVRLRAKIEEKQQQVTARVEAVQALRIRAIRAIMEAENAEVSSFNQSAGDDRKSNVLLYEASCMVNGIPVTLHVTYGNLMYRTMVPVFVHTVVVPFEDVVNVAQTTSFGIQVVSVELDSTKHAKAITIAMGLEVDLLYQLLYELFTMHQCEKKKKTAFLPSLQQQETEKNPSELKKIIVSDEEETKEDEMARIESVMSPIAGDGSAAASALSD